MVSACVCCACFFPFNRIKTTRTFFAREQKENRVQCASGVSTGREINLTGAHITAYRLQLMIFTLIQVIPRSSIKQEATQIQTFNPTVQRCGIHESRFRIKSFGFHYIVRPRAAVHQCVFCSFGYEVHYMGQWKHFTENGHIDNGFVGLGHVLTS